MEGYRGRFAPSPTGPLHFGSLVAAVGSFLAARTRAGVWLVRIEDLDAPRALPGAADEILRTLAACGMHWDGPVLYQSTRTDAYRGALERLRGQGAVYTCACSRREIADSAVAGVEGRVYPGTCRERPAAREGARALRVLTRGAAIAFDDAVQGRIAQDVEKEIGDFVVYRADRVYAYQLAVVVDDAEQDISDVVRGADLLASTPRQIHLQQLLGLPQPRYAHLPVAVNERGEKLSKQTLAPPVDGNDPASALVAALDFLGQRPPAELARAGAVDVWQWAVANWRIERVPRLPAVGAVPASARPG
ncbi:MAG: tRNA glutamyl-Q(34) synthetase GluQRS [Betaproteobacteria bacterium]|nr:tRNA glutamyl-Q(34) synthetase GluQRS [Betaproteobacteria bacterium]